jgi:hypothetical protein
MADLPALSSRIAMTDAGNIVHPSAEDWERATAFVDGEGFKDCRPEWLAQHRDKLIRQSAVAERAKRQDREFHAAVAKSARADERCLAAVEELSSLREGLRRVG